MDKRLLAALLTVLATTAYISDQVPSSTETSVIGIEWQAWKSQHAKHYLDQEEAYRFGIFNERYNMIQEHNSQDFNYKLGLNKFADLSKAEMKTLYHGYKSAAKNVNLEKYEPHFTEYAEAIDWRDQNAVTPVKNQGQCGSCWAFSTIQGIEGAYAIKSMDLISFSPQQLTSCDTYDYGCGGGDLPTGYQYVNENGLETEKDYPYTDDEEEETASKCEVNNADLFIQPGEATGKQIAENDINSFLSALNEGPLSICIDAGSDYFSYYTSGVLDDFKKCGTELDHCVLAVGYNLTAHVPYVVVKNSWTDDWGEGGYIRIAAYSSDDYDGEGVCGIYMEPYLAQVETNYSKAEILLYSVYLLSLFLCFV